MDARHWVETRNALTVDVHNVLGASKSEVNTVQSDGDFRKAIQIIRTNEPDALAIQIMATKSTVNSLDSTARTSDEGCACINDSRAAVTAYVSAINGEGLHVNRPIGLMDKRNPRTTSLTKTQRKVLHGASEPSRVVATKSELTTWGSSGILSKPERELLGRDLILIDKVVPDRSEVVYGNGRESHTANTVKLASKEGYTLLVENLTEVLILGNESTKGNSVFANVPVNRATAVGNVEVLAVSNIGR